MIRGLKLRSGKEERGERASREHRVEGKVGKCRLEGKKGTEVAVVELKSWEDKLGLGI